MVIFACTSTFAWLKLNPNAWFDDMEMEISTNEDLKIAVALKKGTSEPKFTSKLTKTELELAIVAKKEGYMLEYDEATGNYEYTKYANGTEFNTEQKAVAASTLRSIDSYYKQKIKMGPLTSNDGVSFKDKSGNGKDISSGNYISLDIYFGSVGKKSQSVYFSNQESIDEEGNIIPKTTLEISDKATADANLWTNTKWSFDTYLTADTSFSNETVAKAGEKIEYENPNKTFKYNGANVGLVDKNENQLFSVYASDAVRFAVTTTVKEGSTTKTSTRNLYEINEGRGSYATDFSEEYYLSSQNASGAAYDATKNAAFTYYNKAMEYHPIVDPTDPNYNPDDQGKEYFDDPLEPIRFDEMPKTFKGLDSYEASYILDLNENNNYGYNGEAMMTLTLWLEGWDADCIDMILDQSLDLNMSFTNYKSMLEEKSVDVKYLSLDLDDAPVGGFTQEQVESNVVREYNQMQGLEISDLSPIKSSILGKKFVGWKYIDKDGNPQYWTKGSFLKPGSNVPLDAATTGILFYADFE